MPIYIHHNWTIGLLSVLTNNYLIFNFSFQQLEYFLIFQKMFHFPSQKIFFENVSMSKNNIILSNLLFTYNIWLYKCSCMNIFLKKEWTREGHIANDVSGNMWDYNLLNHHIWR